MIEVDACAATNKTNVRLAGSLDIRDANRLHSVLNSLLSEEQKGTVDCSALESLDTACVQLLLAAKRDNRGPVELVFDATNEITKWFDYAGVTDRLRTTGIVQGSTSAENRS